MILLTGATGFVGSHIHRLLREIHTDSIVALGRSPTAGITTCDLLDSRQIDVPWSTAETVIHCAAVIPSKGKIDTFDNIRMTQRLFDLLDPKRVKIIVLISSVAVYHIDRSVADPVHLTEYNCEYSHDEYGRSKLVQEWLARGFCSNGIPLTILRPSSIYGVGNTSRTLLPVLVEKAASGQPITLMGPRRYTQNFVHVNDVARVAVSAAIGKHDGIYNLFSSETLSPETLAKRVVNFFHSTSPIINQLDGSPYPPLIFDNALVRRDFNFEPLTLEAGLAEK